MGGEFLFLLGDFGVPARRGRPVWAAPPSIPRIVCSGCRQAKRPVNLVHPAFLLAIARHSASGANRYAIRTATSKSPVASIPPPTHIERRRTGLSVSARVSGELFDYDRPHLSTAASVWCLTPPSCVRAAGDRTRGASASGEVREAFSRRKSLPTTATSGALSCTPIRSRSDRRLADLRGPVRVSRDAGEFVSAPPDARDRESSCDLLRGVTLDQK